MARKKFNQEERELDFTKAQLNQNTKPENQKADPLSDLGVKSKIKEKKTGSFVRPKYS